MNHDKLQELLKNYRSYKYAVSNGIAPYQSDDTVGMPMGGSYGSRPPEGLNGRGTILDSLMDYNDYAAAIDALEGAVEFVLSDMEQAVIRMKWMDRNTYTLKQIGAIKGMCEKTTGTVHKKALSRLVKAMPQIHVPEIHNLDGIVTYVHVTYDKIS